MEELIITFNDFDKICRICLVAKNDMVTINNQNLINMLEECTSMQESMYDKLPQQICKHCLWQLKTAYEFKQQSAIALDILCKILLKHEVNNENKCKIEIQENEVMPTIKVEVEIDEFKNENKDNLNSRIVLKRECKYKNKKQELCSDDQDSSKDTKEDYIEENEDDESINSEDDESINIQHDNSDNQDLNELEKLELGEQRQKSLADILIKKYKIYDLKCNICKKELSTRSTLLRHMETHNKNRAFKFRCPICSKGFSDKGNLNKHVNRHEGKADYKCDECSKSFYELSALAKHAKTRHGAEAIQCTKCSQTFYHRLQLEAHEQTHEKKEFICDMCGKIFTQKYHLNLHKSTHSEHRPYTCSICNNSFKHKFTLKTHIQLRHIDAERRDMCNVCGKLIHPGGMYQHLETHKDETFKCPDCDKVYTNKYVMHTHRKQVHKSGGIPKRHICEYCKKPYPYASSLRAHINMVHSGPKERLFQCHLCEKSYTRQGLLNAHIRRAHINEKTHVCPTCNKAFYTKSEWKKHNRSHTGERPYPCTICGKSFGFRNVLNTHMKVHSIKQ